VSRETDYLREQGEAFRPVMKRLIDERWEAVWAVIPVAIEGTDSEGVHDVRVASRRLRAAMDVARDAFPGHWYRKLHRMAKQITSELGAVRDREVLLEFLRAELETAAPGERSGIERLLSTVSSELDAARLEMVAFLRELESSGVADDTRKRFGSRESGHLANGAALP
jgi:CHAD domain-containing protein